MKILRIINKQTGMFLRDDFTFNKETEIGLDVTPAQGFYQPKWNGNEWVEGLTEDEILAIKNQSVKVVTEPTPTIEQQVAELQNQLDELRSKL